MNDFIYHNNKALWKVPFLHIFAGLVILVNNRARSISHEANFHRHLVPHPSQERKLDKEREDILMWETEQKRGGSIKKTQKPMKKTYKSIKKTWKDVKDTKRGKTYLCGKLSRKKGRIHTKRHKKTTTKFLDLVTFWLSQYLSSGYIVKIPKSCFYKPHICLLHVMFHTN